MCFSKCTSSIFSTLAPLDEDCGVLSAIDRSWYLGRVIMYWVAAADAKSVLPKKDWGLVRSAR